MSTYPQLIIPASFQRKWDNVSLELDSQQDALGYPVDKGIKQIIIAFNTMGFPTIGSCEGHLDEGFACPWVDVAAPDQPERFKNEQKFLISLMNEYFIGKHEIFSAEHELAYKSWISRADILEESSEFHSWVSQNNELFIKLDRIVKQFNNQHIVPQQVFIQLIGPETIVRVYVGSLLTGEELSIKGEIKDKDISDHLDSCRVVFCQFVQFLFNTHHTI